MQCGRMINPHVLIREAGSTLTEMMQVRPSRMWSPARLASLSLSALLFRPSTFIVRVSAACKTGSLLTPCSAPCAGVACMSNRHCESQLQQSTNVPSKKRRVEHQFEAVVQEVLHTELAGTLACANSLAAIAVHPFCMRQAMA